VPADRLRATLGVHSVAFRASESALAIVDIPLA
jgi:hypothetical protein